MLVNLGEPILPTEGGTNTSFVFVSTPQSVEENMVWEVQLTDAMMKKSWQLGELQAPVTMMFKEERGFLKNCDQVPLTTAQLQ